MKKKAMLLLPILLLASSCSSGGWKSMKEENIKYFQVYQSGVSLHAVSDSSCDEMYYRIEMNGDYTHVDICEVDYGKSTSYCYKGYNIVIAYRTDLGKESAN